MTSDAEFVREVFDASYRRLVVQLLALCHDQAEAEDAVQEAFVRAIGRARQFVTLDNPEAWLRTVALNHIRNRWRHLTVVRRVLPQLPGVQHDI
ncbi:MAG: sigma factor, partial [Nocardioidaceae bacterium]